MNDRSIHMSESIDRAIGEDKVVTPYDSAETEVVAERPSESISALHDARRALTDIRRSSRAAAQAAVDKTRIAARATDHYIHDSPWVVIGASALLAAAVGYFIGRR